MFVYFVFFFILREVCVCVCVYETLVSFSGRDVNFWWIFYSFNSLWPWQWGNKDVKNHGTNRKTATTRNRVICSSNSYTFIFSLPRFCCSCLVVDYICFTIIRYCCYYNSSAVVAATVVRFILWILPILEWLPFYWKFNTILPSFLEKNL